MGPLGVFDDWNRSVHTAHFRCLLDQHHNLSLPIPHFLDPNLEKKTNLDLRFWKP